MYAKHELKLFKNVYVFILPFNTSCLIFLDCQILIKIIEYVSQLSKTIS